MCQFFQVIVNGEDQAPNGVPQNLLVFARVSETCKLVEVTVIHNGVTLAIADLVPTGSVIVINGVPTKYISLMFHTGDRVKCGDSVTVNLKCKQGANCSDTFIRQVRCKFPPEEPTDCLGSNDVSIELLNNGNPVDITGTCVPAGNYTANLVGSPPGSQIYWSLEVDGVSANLGTGNPIPFVLPGGTSTIVLIATISPQVADNCPPFSKSVVFPDRQGECPTEILFEIRKDGAVIPVGTYGNLAAGIYDVEVLSPVGSGITYTFELDSVVIYNGSSSTTTIDLAVSNTEFTLEIFASTSDCCPILDIDQTLKTSTEDQPPGGGTEEDPDEDDPWDFSWCGLLYAALMLAVAAFIGTYVFAFLTFPPSPALLIALGVELAVVLALLAVLKWLCNFSFCRALRVLTWMFIWAAIGCLITFFVTLFAFPSLLIGCLIAGIIALSLGLWLHSRNCKFPKLFGLP